MMKKISSCVSAFALVCLFGCLRQTMRIELQPEFKGQVTIQCKGRGEPTAAVIVDGTGAGDAYACPKSEPLLAVSRGGQLVRIDGSVAWSREGSGIPTGFQFLVK